MSLKVLLADDSAAIKKVIQLSLQDLGLELKSISSGKDALSLAKEFKPDIAFIDVMLPQKNGYEIAAEIRKDSHLGKTPIVLLWSAFMAFDDAKFATSGANASLEKPFDAAALRAMVSKLVPKAALNPLSQHIDLPNIEFETPIGTVPPAKKGKVPEPPKAVTQPPPAAPAPAEPADWSSDFQDLNAFSSNMEKTVSTPDPAAWSGDNEWVKKDLGKFNVTIPEDNDKDAVPFEYTDSKIVDTSFLFKPVDEKTAVIQKEASPQTPIGGASSLSLEELSDIKLEAREIIEKIAWKLVPELANQIIKDELERLLSEEK